MPRYMAPYELSLSFSSPKKVPSLDVAKFAEMETYFEGNQISVHIVDEAQVVDAFQAIREAGIRARKFYLSSKKNHPDQIDPDFLVGATLGPDRVDVIQDDLDCRAFIPETHSIHLLRAPARSRPFRCAVNRLVTNRELADYFTDAAHIECNDVFIDGQVTPEWKALTFSQRHDILHWLPQPKSSRCRFCKAELGGSPDTLIGRDLDWPMTLYSDSNAHGHGNQEYTLFVPIAQFSDFHRWTNRSASRSHPSVEFQQVYSDSVGPGGIAFRALNGTL